jgi:uncharacterized protein YfaS (alpha-2-macroglobulin family)
MKRCLKLLVPASLAALAVTLGGRPSSKAAPGGVSPLEMQILGQSEWLVGGPASLRVVLTNHETGAPLRGQVRLTLFPKGPEARTYPLLTRKTDARGTLAASFVVPEAPPGGYELEVAASTALGTDSVMLPVSLRRESQILLTTDKPLYQPGQTVHLRALALRRPSLVPAGNQEITLEIEDGKGNKVFKKSLQASEFGVVSATFQLADEVNFGTWTARAVMPTGTVEKKFEVKRYVLPKFKVTVTTDKKYYLPGETMTGKVQADYFFGKPVSGGEVEIELSSFDVEFHKVAELSGKTDANGTHRFEAKLPEYFVGQPLEQGNAFVKLDARVTDKAEHTEKITDTAPVAKEPLVITVVPESGELKTGLGNRLYILVSYPDGEPAKAQVAAGPRKAMLRSGREVSFLDVLSSTRATDKTGIAEMDIPVYAQSDWTNVTIEVRATDAQGNKAVKELTLGTTAGRDAILLRADKALAKVGQTVILTALSTTRTGTIYLDVIRDRQTILTQALDLRNGKATLELPLTQDMVGTLVLHAYKILPSEDIIRDTRLLHVAPADDLTIEIRPDQQTYRPGQAAKVNFVVQDRQRRPVQAALGITVVDESVFALAEMQPGLEKIYFTLEKELMKPRYEIHGFTAEGVVSGKFPFQPEARPAEEEAQRQKIARVLFAASAPSVEFSLRRNTYAERIAKLREEWTKRMVEDAKRIDRALQSYYNRHQAYLAKEDGIETLVDEGLLRGRDLRDQWNRPYRIEWRGGQCGLSSAGLDGRWETVDDLTNIGAWALEKGEREMAFADGRLLRGAGGARILEQAEAMAMAAPEGKAAAAAPTARPEVRLRQFFPETMYVNPALITDEKGRATASFEMADSITTWRLTALASSLRGQLGSNTAGLRVFQDFFVDIDLPVSLTQNDEVSIPVAVYNYLPTKQSVKLSLSVPAVDKIGLAGGEPRWFDPLDKSILRSVEMGPSEVGAVYFRIRVTRIGTHKLTVKAEGSKLSDAIRREIEVLPDGKEIRDTINDRLEGPVARTVTIPKNAIAEASEIFVKIYPGVFSQAVEGLDAMLRMPFGCFEQTSSVTYPNVLVMDYLKRTKQIKPELQMKAEQYINVGYQRLVSYEVKGGGFSWFGNAPAHKVLTAYGLLEFGDMSRVHEVDPRLISRTQEWLAAQQEKDGSWEPDKGGIAEGIINRQTDTLRTTAYIAWALAESGYRGAALERGLTYLRGRYQKEDDPYVLAVVANAFLSAKKDDPEGLAAADRLAELAVKEEKAAYWKSAAPTFTGAKSEQADLETTGLATYALLKSGRHHDLVNKALTYLIRSKDSFGTWHTTQATVWSLRALLLAMERATAEIDATVGLKINGEEGPSFRITPADFDVMRQVSWGGRPGENKVEISFTGKGSALYQIVARYYLPWNLVRPEAGEALEISVSYDRTTLAKDDILTATARVANLQPLTANMVVLDLGVPPGFEVLAEDFQKLVDKGAIEKFTVAARQVIVYLEKLGPRRRLELSYRFKAKFPIRAKTPKSRVYEYYNPEKEAIASPVELEVK